jgi:hypothetical protein
MKFIRVISIVLIALALYSSCSTSFNPAAPYKNITVVYGLLSLSDSVHYIKIEKAFLSENGGNAYTEAQVADSIYYPAGTISAVLDDYSNGILVNTIPLKDTMGPGKQTGVFANTPNIVYELPRTTTLNPNDNYELIVTNNKTGAVTSAQTTLVNSFYVTNPTPGAGGSVNFNPTLGSLFIASWQNAVNAALYQLVVRFRYKEMNTSDTSLNPVYDTLTWTFPPFAGSGSTNVYQDITGQSFYTFVKSLVPVNPNVERRAVSFDFLIYAGGNAFYTYQQVSIANSTSLVYGQTNPTYTNVSNGLGLFSSTYLNAENNLAVAGMTMDSLACSSYTSNLNFLNSKNKLCGQ